MCQTIECSTKVRLSFSGGPHTPVIMADSMENAGSWTASGSKEVMEVQKNFKDLRKLGVQNIARTVQCSKRAISYLFPTNIHFYHTICHVCRSVWRAREAKPHFGVMLVRSVHDCETYLLSPHAWD